MTCTTTNATDNVCGEITLLRTVILAMANTTTVLANLVLIIAQSTVESGKFTELVPFVVILAFGCRSGLEALS